MAAPAASDLVATSQPLVRPTVSVTPEPADRCSSLTLLDRGRHLVYRCLAKFAFHNASLYRQLLDRACSRAGVEAPSRQIIDSIRKLDPNGLGVWYLSRAGQSPRLVELCRRALTTPGSGPPRGVTRLLERALAGERVCWFGESGGFDALYAETLIAISLAAALSAAELVWTDEKPNWSGALHNLTIAANSAQAAVRAHRRVAGWNEPSAEEAARLAFQAVNVARRALNHTDLMAVDEQLARESARLALSAGNFACSAAIHLTGLPPTGQPTPEASASQTKLAALARSVDALVSRISACLRSDSPASTTRDFVLEQSARILREIPRTLRPWFILLPAADTERDRAEVRELCERSNQLAETSTEILDCWATLHELLSPTASYGKSPRAITARPPTPAWATQLVRIVSGQWTSREVLDAVRDLTGPRDQAVPAAACIAALSRGSLKLRGDLWKLIRDIQSSDIERSLMFQLFQRLGPHSSIR